MNCPKCDESILDVVEINELEINSCPACKGAWFDRVELALLLKLDIKKLAPLMGGDGQDIRSIAACPKCDKRMLRVAGSSDHSVVLDTCAFCQGIWCDGGEFARLRLANR